MAPRSAFVTYQEAARLTGKTARTIRRKISDGVIAESQTQRENGHVTISVAELERVFGKLRRPRPDMSGDTGGQKRGQMSGQVAGGNFGKGENKPGFTP